LELRGSSWSKVEICEKQVQEYLSNVTIKKFVAPKGITVQKRLFDDECIER